MTTTNDALQSPFSLLASTVRDLSSGGRPALGARLKPELYRRYGITEQQLGFLKFGDFLRAAERAGFVQLRRTPGGDLEVLPTESTPVGVRVIPAAAVPAPVPGSFVVPAPTSGARPWLTTSQTSSPVRVRPDLWSAFTSFYAPWVYDVSRDAAYKAPGMISVESQGAHVLQIPSGRERATEWMKAFAEIQDPEAKARLQSALQGDPAAQRFNLVIRADMRLHKSWRRYHIQQVVAAIEAWAASNRIHPRDITVPYLPPYQRMPRVAWPDVRVDVVPTGVLPLAQSTPTAPIAVTQFPGLTPRLASLIDQMIDELLRLRGTLQVVEPKR